MKYEDIFIETKEPFSHKPTHMKETNPTPTDLVWKRSQPFVE